jgi:hypothetical protein
VPPCGRPHHGHDSLHVRIEQTFAEHALANHSRRPEQDDVHIAAFVVGFRV